MSIETKSKRNKCTNKYKGIGILHEFKYRRVTESKIHGNNCYEYHADTSQAEKTLIREITTKERMKKVTRENRRRSEECTRSCTHNRWEKCTEEDDLENERSMIEYQWRNHAFSIIHTDKTRFQYTSNESKTKWDHCKWEVQESRDDRSPSSGIRILCRHDTLIDILLWYRAKPNCNPCCNVGEIILCA